MKIIKFNNLLILLLTFLTALFATTNSMQSKKNPELDKKKSNRANYGKYDFTLTTLDKKTIRLSDYAGKVVLVNIWAPWCGPCKMEAPGFVKLYQKYKSKGFEIIGIAVQTNIKDVKAFLQKYKITWPNGINDDIASKYETYGLPDNYLFASDGSLIKRFIGMTHEKTLEPFIEKALKEVNIPSTK